ncbi:hypothetical protein P4S72_14625 [Vibrio sp. PP-XX7]
MDNNLSMNLALADQSLKNFMADLLEVLSNKIKIEDEPCVRLEYFGAVMEIRLVSFGNLTISRSTKSGHYLIHLYLSGALYNKF